MIGMAAVTDFAVDGLWCRGPEGRAAARAPASGGIGPVHRLPSPGGAGRTRRMAGAVAWRDGAAAEGAVARHYEHAGHAIAERRWRGAGGEIDLIARDAEGLVFIEVKKARSFAAAAERVSARQMARIAASASEYLAGEPAGQNTPVRFDVALVDRAGAVEIIENAFGH